GSSRHRGDLAGRFRVEWGRGGGARDNRRDGPPAAGCDVRPRQRAERFFFRPGNQRAELYSPARISGASGSGGALVGGPCQDRKVEGGGGGEAYEKAGILIL